MGTCILTTFSSAKSNAWLIVWCGISKYNLEPTSLNMNKLSGLTDDLEVDDLSDFPAVYEKTDADADDDDEVGLVVEDIEEDNE